MATFFRQVTEHIGVGFGVLIVVVMNVAIFWDIAPCSMDYTVFSFSSVGITTVLTLSTISLDSRIDLPKVRYATALDWFLLMSFFYCIATLLEFAGVHYFTKASPYMSADVYGCKTWADILWEGHLPKVFKNKYVDI
jgi:hypothetical protein